MNSPQGPDRLLLDTNRTQVKFSRPSTHFSATIQNQVIKRLGPSGRYVVSNGTIFVGGKGERCHRPQHLISDFDLPSRTVRKVRTDIDRQPFFQPMIDRVIAKALSGPQSSGLLLHVRRDPGHGDVEEEYDNEDDGFSKQTPKAGN